MMLKLIKHEFIKLRVLLFIIPLAFIILEGTFIYSIFSKNAYLTANADNFIFSCIILSFCAIAITSIYLLRRDMNNKTGYLIFMTPNKISSIVISKLICALISVIGVMFISGILLKINHPMIEKSYEIYGDYRFFTYDLYTILDFKNANIFHLLGFALVFLIFYLALVTTLYLTTAISNIISKNSIFNIITLILSIGFIILLSAIYNSFIEMTSSGYGLAIMFNDPFERYGMLPAVYSTKNYDVQKYFIHNLPMGILQLVISAGCIWGSSRIIEKTDI